MANSYLRHPDNFFAATRALTLEQRGAYSDILDLYISRDGLLPDDEIQMARCLSIDPRVWRRVRGELLACGKIELRDSFIVPRGGDTTLARCLAASEAGTKAAETRWANHMKNNKTQDAVAMPLSQVISDQDKSKEAVYPSKDKKVDGYTPEFEEFWNVYPKKVGKGDALKAYKSAKKRGATHEQIRAGAERYAAGCLQARTEKRFTRGAEKWLNGDGWLDEDGPPSGPSSGSDGQKTSGTVAAARRLIDKHRRDHQQ